MIDKAALRMLDANFNRAREALRTLEDYARFILNDSELSAQYKSMRHELCSHLAALNARHAVFYRDTPGDVGVQIKAEDELRRESLEHIVAAAAKRLTEALRVLEELAKLNTPADARKIESLRYQAYTAEQVLAGQTSQQNRISRIGLHVLLTESLCRRPWHETLEAVLEGGADVIQLREKDLRDAELLNRSMMVVQKCRKYKRLSIINDRIDIALAAGASGVHLGQQDMPCGQARKLAGGKLIIGISTENVLQARTAARAGATYIGAGPMFPTTTKEKPRLAGSAYIRELTGEKFPLPVIAIGGISLQNLPELMTAGTRAVAVSSAVLSADDPAKMCRQLRAMLIAATSSGSARNPATINTVGHE